MDSDSSYYERIISPKLDFNHHGVDSHRRNVLMFEVQDPVGWKFFKKKNVADIINHLNVDSSEHISTTDVLKTMEQIWRNNRYGHVLGEDHDLTDAEIEQRVARMLESTKRHIKLSMAMCHQEEEHIQQIQQIQQLHRYIPNTTHRPRITGNSVKTQHKVNFI